MSTDRVTLQVAERGDDQRGSRNVRRLRAQGLVPGVLYGKGHTRPFVVGERELRAVLSGPSGLHAIVDVVLEGQTTPHHAVLKDFQRHPVRGTVTHVDFHEVRLDRPIQATVQLQLVGESPGARMGGIVQPATREVRIEALPTAIPEHIEVSIDTLEIGGSVRIEDLPELTGIVILDDPTTVLASCVAPRGVSEEDELAEAAEGEAAAGDGSGAADNADDADSEG